MNQVLKGKVALVTGANQGLGLQICQHYVEQGASLAMCARNAQMLEEARRELTGRLSTGQRIFAMSADVSRESDVKQFVERATVDFGGIDILVNNAGVYGPKGGIEEVDWQQWVDAIQVNLMGSVLMCRAVVPGMKARRRGKIIQLSGGGATNPMPRISAYATSKAAIVRFAESLALEVAEYGIDVNAVAPGALNTRLLEEVIAAGPDQVGAAFYEKSLKQKASGGSPLTTGADLCVFLASDASDGITGKLISAIWDNWQGWPGHVEELQGSDAYTLRRITGRDRGLGWGDK